MTKPADSDQRAKARERVAIKWLAEQGYQPSDEGFETWKRHGTTVGIQGLDLSGLLTSFAISERQAVIEDCCRAVCPWCRLIGMPTERDSVTTANGKPHWHKDDGMWRECYAAAIRSME